MTSLLDGARKLVTRGSGIDSRLEGLDAATRASRGRLDDDLVDDAGAVVDRASNRLRLSADHTVVAIAGATGSGKSSTFNALTGLDLAAVGVRRPTTSHTTACVWGDEGAPELLEWLGIPARHQVTRGSMLDTGREDTSMEGLVKLADLLVWVLDPQKYADAAIHSRYLAPLATHSDVMLVVLNHIDTVPESGRESMLADVRRLLDADGLGDVPLFAASARTKTGIPELRAEISSRVAAKKSARARLDADIKAAAGRLKEATGWGRPQTLARQRVSALEDAFADAAGVPTVVAAVEQSTRLRANRATGWPVTSWLSRLKPDPLKRLHLDLGRGGRKLTAQARTSVPQPTQVQRARVDTEVRSLADEVSVELARPWVRAIRAASVSRLDDLGDRLDAALASTDLGVARIPGWAGIVQALQWLLILTAVVGAGWLAMLAGMGYLQLPAPGTPAYRGVPVPTLMLLGGVAAGVVLALVCRLLVAWTARRRARSADRRLRAAIREVSEELVVKPVEAELEAYAAVRAGLAQALR
jgi:GTP-binding protein EngB required for normal cell division